MEIFNASLFKYIDLDYLIKFIDNKHEPFSRLVTLLFHKWLHVRLNHKRRLYLNVNLMTALNYKTWMVQTLKLN
jgi:hypothetical protein